MKIFIKGKLPTLNDYISAINHNRHTGNKLKQDTENMIGWQIKAQTKEKIDYPVKIHFHWISADKRIDHDNRYSSKKFILDSLQKTGVLKNDSQKWVTDLFDHHPIIDKNNVGVIVEILRSE